MRADDNERGYQSQTERSFKRKAVLAKQAYRSAFHHYARLYAQKYCTHHIIFSAKYGLMEPDFLIEGPYDVTFSRPEDPCISTDEIILQAKRYDRFSSIMILCPRAYADQITSTFKKQNHKLIFPLNNKGGFGAMHSFLKNLHNPYS